MKKTVLVKTNARFLSLLAGMALAAMLSTSPAAAKASGLVYEPDPHSMDNWSDTVHSIQINKFQTSKKNKIRLYPDARQQVLFFSANGEDKKIYQLYLFDMDGRLVHQTAIRNKETTVLTSITEGDYLFEVFTDDERIENGHLVVR